MHLVKQALLLSAELVISTVEFAFTKLFFSPKGGFSFINKTKRIIKLLSRSCI